MLSRKLVFIVLLFFIHSETIFGQFTYSDTCAKIHHAILSLDFEQSEKLISTCNESENGIIYWLTAYQVFLKELTSGNSNTNQTIQILTETIAKLKPLDKSSPYYNFCLSDVILFRAFLEFQQQYYIDALTDYLKADRYIQKNQELFPLFEIEKRHVLITLLTNAAFAENLPFVQSDKVLSNFREEFEQTFSHLLNSPELQPEFKREVQLLSALLYPFLSDQSDASFKLVSTFGTNWSISGPLENYVFAESAIKAGEHEQAVRQLKKGNQSGFFESFNLLNLIYGNELLNQLNDSSIIYLSEFCHEQTNQKKVSYARLKMSWYFFLNNEPAKTDSLIQLIKQTIPSNTSEDQQAIYEIRHRKNWTLPLLESRLYFDGGREKKSLDILLENRPFIEQYNQEQRLEYAYRLARAYHQLHEWEKALIFYQMVISSGLDNNYYYPAYAAFYAGQIYFQLNNPEQAKRFLNLCLHLDTPIYKESIRQKANLELKKYNLK